MRGVRAWIHSLQAKGNDCNTVTRLGCRLRLAHRRNMFIHTRTHTHTHTHTLQHQLTSFSKRTSCAFPTSTGVFTLGDARSFLAVTSKIPPLGSMLNFDADVKKTTARHPPNVKTAMGDRDKSVCDRHLPLHATIATLPSQGAHVHFAFVLCSHEKKTLCRLERSDVQISTVRFSALKILRTTKTRESKLHSSKPENQHRCWEGLIEAWVWTSLRCLMTEVGAVFPTDAKSIPPSLVRVEGRVSLTRHGNQR